MSADIVNLRKARKAKARATKEETAQENRVRFGLTKAERERQQSAKDKIERELDGAKRANEGPSPAVGHKNGAVDDRD
jgi:Domain of unknown function (DUF4169)